MITDSLLMAMVAALLMVLLLPASMLTDAAGSGCFFLVFIAFLLVIAEAVFFNCFGFGDTFAAAAPTLLAAAPRHVRHGGVIEMEL